MVITSYVWFLKNRLNQHFIKYITCSVNNINPKIFRKRGSFYTILSNSSIDLFFLCTTLFCYRVISVEKLYIIPCFSHKELNVSSAHSPMITPYRANAVAFF